MNDPTMQPRLEPRPEDDAQFLQGEGHTAPAVLQVASHAFLSLRMAMRWRWPSMLFYVRRWPYRVGCLPSALVVWVAVYCMLVGFLTHFLRWFRSLGGHSCPL